MGIDEESSRRAGSDARSGTSISGVLGKVLTFTAAAGLLIVAFIFSLVLVAVVVTGGLLILGYVWWKTRELRKRMREQTLGGRVIEGEVIRDGEGDDKGQTSHSQSKPIQPLRR